MAVYQIRSDTAANWTATNPVLAEGEPARETDTGKWKVGDGVTAWNALPYFPSADQGDVTISETIITGSPAASAVISLPSDRPYLGFTIEGWFRSALAAVTDALYMRLNGDATAKYTWTFGWQQGAVAVSSTGTLPTSYIQIQSMPAASATADRYGYFRVEILYPLETTRWKGVLWDSFAHSTQGDLNTLYNIPCGWADYRDLAALTSATFYGGGDIAVGSTFKLTAHL